MNNFCYSIYIFLTLFIFTSCSNNSKEEALSESRNIIHEQDREIDRFKSRIDTLEQTIRALGQLRSLSDKQKQELKEKADELEEAIKNYQARLEAKEKEFRSYRNLALEQKKIDEIREQKRKLEEDNEFIVTHIKQIKQMREVNEVMNGLSSIIEKIPHFNKFDCYYRDKKDQEKAASGNTSFSPKLLLIEQEGVYPIEDVGRILIDLDLNFFKLEGNPSQATLTICLHEEGKTTPIFCQDELFDSEYKRVEWKQNISEFAPKSYFFQVKYGDQILTDRYQFKMSK
ncbi:MAG: hypothetical protein JJT94_09455 [Bernardetiaceae bacterium]|nr:hypothetical protein [Bernardetiaceae bacterium]